MRLLILSGLLALMISTTHARDNRGDKRYRKFRSFSPKDKRGTDYPSSHTSLGHTSGLFQAISANTGHFARIPNGYVHQGLEQFSPGQSASFLPLTSSTNEMGNGFKHNGLYLTLPASSQMLSASKTGPITFALPSGSEAGASKGSIIQSHNQGGSSPGFINLGSLAYNLHAGSSNNHMGSSNNHIGSSNFHMGSANNHIGSSNNHIGSSNFHTGSSNFHMGSSNLPAGSSNFHMGSSSYHPGARAVSGGLLFAETPSPSPPTYHIGLSSGSSDSSSYHLPISSSEYPESGGSQQRYQPAVSSGSSYASPETPVYSLPSTNYGIPSNAYSSYASAASNPSVHYSSGSITPSHSNTAVSYASPTTSYAVSSDYPSDSQTSTAYGSREQGSYSNISPMFVSQVAKGQNEDSFHKYDTISYSSHNGKY